MHNTLKRAGLAAVAAVSLLFGALSAVAPAVAAPRAGSTAVADNSNPGSHPTHVGLTRRSTSKLITCPAAGCYFWAGGDQTAASPVTTVNTLASIDDPWVSTGFAWHTLIEVAIHDPVNNNTIEMGVTRDTYTYGDWLPRLFAFTWKNGVAQGYNANFVDYTGNAVNLGADMTPYLNTEKGIGISHDTATSKWGVYFNGVLVASVADSKWTSSQFTGGTEVQIFGEVDGKDDHPCTDMGGNPAALPTSTTYASRFTGTQYQAGGPAVGLSAYSAADSTPVNTNAYDAVMKSGSVITVNYGGPGDC